MLISDLSPGNAAPHCALGSANDMDTGENCLNLSTPSGVGASAHGAYGAVAEEAIQAKANAMAQAKALKDAAMAKVRAASDKLWVNETPEEKFGKLHNAGLLAAIKEAYCAMSLASCTSCNSNTSQPSQLCLATAGIPKVFLACGQLPKHSQPHIV